MQSFCGKNLTDFPKNAIISLSPDTKGGTPMKSTTKALLSILLILAVIGYTVMNYLSGKTETTAFLVFMAILCLPLVNMINILIQQLREK